MIKSFGLNRQNSSTPLLAADAIVEAGLDWNVKLHDLVVAHDEDISVPTHKAIVRTSDYRTLGVVGNRYQPVQNKEAFSFMDSLVGEGLMRYHSAGSFRNGQRVWIIGKLGSFEVVDNDLVDEYVFLYNSHDGSSSLKCFPTTMRIVCENMINAIINTDGKTGISIRHTSNVMNHFIKAQEVLHQSCQSIGKFKEFAEVAARLNMKTSKVNEFLHNVFPDPLEEVQSKTAEKVRTQVLELIDGGRGTDISGVRGTGWGTFNAVTEYINHHKRSRGENQQEKRFESVLFGGSANIVRKAAKEILRLAA
jgi:phage/plasmid-like protein (TIGR03299 family)